MRLIAIIVGMLVVRGSTATEADAPVRQVEAFYQRLDSDCGNTFFTINRDFEKAFPENDQADVLAQVIERAAKDPKDNLILANVMYFIGHFARPDKTKPWNTRLETALLAQARHPDAGVREACVMALFSRHESELRNIILSFLKDESDRVRQRVVEEINEEKWPDATVIDLEYIKRTQLEGYHRQSVIAAKRFTNPADNARAEQISMASTQPEAQKVLLAYISLHKDDPDHEVSVDTAERFYQSIEANIKFQKAEDDEKKRVEFLHANVNFLDRPVTLTKNATQFEQRPFSDQVNFIYWLFDTKDSTTSQYAYYYCKLAVPPKDQVPVLTELAERATHGSVNNEVLLNILIFSEHQRDPSPQVGVWSQQLESLIWQQKDNPDSHIRNYIIRYINGWEKTDYRDRVLSFLSDKDADVLQMAIDAIANWPDRLVIYDKYLAEHRSDPTYGAGAHFISSLKSGW